jgi:hypothetical protein
MSEYKPMNNDSLLNMVANILMNECVDGDTRNLESLLLYVPAQTLLDFARGDSWAVPHLFAPAEELLNDNDYAKGKPTYE